VHFSLDTGYSPMQDPVIAASRHCESRLFWMRGVGSAWQILQIVGVFALVSFVVCVGALFFLLFVWVT